MNVINSGITVRLHDVYIVTNNMYLHAMTHISSSKKFSFLLATLAETRHSKTVVHNLTLL